MQQRVSIASIRTCYFEGTVSTYRAFDTQATESLKLKCNTEKSKLLNTTQQVYQYVCMLLGNSLQNVILMPNI